MSFFLTRMALRTWLDSDLEPHEQQRQRRTLGFIVVIFHGICVPERKSWLGRSIMVSCAAVANLDVHET